MNGLNQDDILELKRIMRQEFDNGKMNLDNEDLYLVGQSWEEFCTNKSMKSDNSYDITQVPVSA